MHGLKSLHRSMGKVLEYLLNYEHIVKFQVSSDVQLERIVQAYEGDAGFDLFVSRDVRLRAGETSDVSTGVYVEPSEKIYFTIVGRSLCRARGILVSVALIDNGYRGELFAIAHNYTRGEVRIHAGERICQLVPYRLIPVKFKKVKLIGYSDRGKKGFGSSGI